MGPHGACESCQFFVEIGDQQRMAEHGLRRPAFGECRRHPPRVFYVEPSNEAIETGIDEKADDPFDPGFRTKWPIVQHEDSCGEYAFTA